MYKKAVGKFATLNFAAVRWGCIFFSLLNLFMYFILLKLVLPHRDFKQLSLRVFEGKNTRWSTRDHLLQKLLSILETDGIGWDRDDMPFYHATIRGHLKRIKHKCLFGCPLPAPCWLDGDMELMWFRMGVECSKSRSQVLLGFLSNK